MTGLLRQAILIALSLATSAVTVAQPMPPAASPSKAADTRPALTNGEVRSIDKEQKKLTLRHEEIKSLDMPAMSMAFNVRDPTLLDKVAVGDKVRFRAEKIDGLFYVTAIEK